MQIGDIVVIRRKGDKYVVVAKEIDDYNGKTFWVIRSLTTGRKRHINAISLEVLSEATT